VSGIDRTDVVLPGLAYNKRQLLDETTIMMLPSPMPPIRNADRLLGAWVFGFLLWVAVCSVWPAVGSAKGIQDPPDSAPHNAMNPLEGPQAGLPTTNMRLNGKIYRLEVAATPAQAEKGLMFRTSLPPRQGMLFLFQPAKPVKFWMKNTKIPLDMLFLSQGRITFIQAGAQPCLADPCAIYGPDTPVDMVVELPSGTAAKNGIGLGAQAQVGWPDLAKSAALHTAGTPIQESR
jgi:uncharacterized membrane protein (UPF0127 family)